MTHDPIPFNRPGLTGRELDYIAEAVGNGHISGNGPFSRRCAWSLEKELGAPKVLMTSSCTHALEIAALLLDMQPGDEFLVPSFTFVSTAGAFCLRGARPVFVDIRPDTLNIDETLIADRLSPRTKAIVVVHYAGVGCEMEAIMAIADRHRVAVVEDNAHGLFGSYRHRPLGTFAPLAALSFHETKNITCGEGGALVINDPSFVKRAEIIHDKGTDRRRFFRGEVDKYTWLDLGSSYVLSDMNAAFLLAQLENREDIQKRRKRVWQYYQKHLRDWAAEHQVALPQAPDHCRHPYHMFHLLLPTEKGRDALITHLKSHDIMGVFHYLPLHLSKMGRGFGGRRGDCPVTENVSARLLRLPFFPGLTGEQQERVVAAVKAFDAF